MKNDRTSGPADINAYGDGGLGGRGASPPESNDAAAAAVEGRFVDVRKYDRNNG